MAAPLGQADAIDVSANGGSLQQDSWMDRDCMRPHDVLIRQSGAQTQPAS
jgi:hypothetical protein